MDPFPVFKLLIEFLSGSGAIMEDLEQRLKIFVNTPEAQLFPSFSTCPQSSTNLSVFSFTLVI